MLRLFRSESEFYNFFVFGLGSILVDIEIKYVVAFEGIMRSPQTSFPFNSIVQLFLFMLSLPHVYVVD